MSRKEQSKQDSQRLQMQCSDMQNLSENGYSHGHHNHMQQSEEVVANEVDSQSQKKGKSTAKDVLIPTDIFDFFRDYCEMKKPAVKAVLKKWGSAILELETRLNSCELPRQQNSRLIRNKRQSVNAKAISFINIQSTLLSHSTKSSQKLPHDTDFCSFVASICTSNVDRCDLRVDFDEKHTCDVSQSSSENRKEEETQFDCSRFIAKTARVISVGFGSKRFASLMELCLRVSNPILHNKQFYETCMNSIDYPLLRYFEICFACFTVHTDGFSVEGNQLVSLSYRLKTQCRVLNTVILDFFPKISFIKDEMSLFSDNLSNLQRLIIIEIHFRDAIDLTAKDIMRLLRCLTSKEKTHLEISFEKSTHIVMTEEFAEFTKNLLDIPQLKYLKNLVLNFPVVYPEGMEIYKKEISTSLNGIFERTPYLNKCNIFVPLQQNTDRLLTLKSFNFQKIWIQLLKMNQLGLLSKFRKEVSWQILEYQEIFIF